MTLLKWVAAAFWVAFAAALVSHINGNPTAINGVIGAGVCAVVCTVLALIDR